MTSPPSDPVPSSPGGARPNDKEGVSPWQETVRLSPVPSGPKSSTPAIPDEASAAPATARFGKFIRTLRLGAGGMGEVWKAWDSVLGRWVALKFLKGGDDDEIARFRREAQTAGRLHHPNIAAIYEVNEDQGRQYIAMQFVDGQNLHQFPREDRTLLVRLVLDAARALQYAHEQGVIHRDLKPENLMVAVRGNERHVFLMDFGLARAAEGASKISATGFLVGTPMYMSPEQARGEKVDVRSDIYSLGLTLYELLTDRKPFESESVYETLRRVQEIDPPAMRQVDRRILPDVETVVMKAISKDPASRYATAQEFADDLGATLRGEAIQGRRESISRKLIRRVRRHPLAFAAGTILVIGLTISGTIAAGASRDRRITELTTKIEAALRAREWTEDHLQSVERLLLDLEKIAPDLAGTRRARLPQALADSISAADLARARLQLALLERVDPREAARVAAELRQRESIWPGVFTLEPPFIAAATVFGPGRVQAAGDLLRSAESGAVRTRTACEGNVQLKAEFDGAWKESSQLGLMLNVTNESGYHFLLSTADGPTAPSFASIHDAKGNFRLQIRRGDLLLREEPVKAETVPLGATLRLMARRQGDLLSLQVNELKMVEFRDPFALAAAQKGFFGISWPTGVGIRRLLATHEILAIKPSLMDVGDDLFLQGKFEEALDRYGEAGQAAAAADVREEALYKQGLCNLQLNREDAAKKIFEGVAAGFLTSKKGGETRWYFLSDCQLLVLYFREKDGIDQATTILNKLPEYQYTFDQLALQMPPDVQRQVLQASQTGSIGGNFHRRPEEHVARTEFGVRASELLEPPSHRGEWQYHHLMRAYMMVGRTVDALRTAEKSFRIFRYGGEVLDDYCWVRRLSGDVQEIRSALAAIDRGLAGDSLHLVERARIHCALKDWASAAKDLDAFLATPRDYHSWSSACLLRGVVAELQGAPADQIEEAWRRGLPKNWQPPKEGRPRDQADFTKLQVGMPILNYWIMASLLGEMSDAEAEQLLAGLTSFAGKDNPVFNRLMRPSMLRASWRTPRAREVARHIALRDISFTDVARWPLFVGWVRFVHEVCFNAAEALSPDQDELLWRMSEEIYTAYREGTLTDRYFLPFGAIVAGNPNAPGMGWREVATLLEKIPRLRGPLAYVFGQRYVKKGDPKTALMFFKAAAADADREPPYPLLQRLAKTEVDALTPK
jgi:tetratricopeptide (TPR) repeat protein/predicted Ser/Thr protein kinase